MPRLAFEFLLTSSYFAYCAGCLVLAMVAAEWRAIRPPPAEDTRIRSGMWLRRLVSILRWVTALGIVAIALMGGMLDML